MTSVNPSSRLSTLLRSRKFWLAMTGCAVAGVLGLMILHWMGVHPSHFKAWSLHTIEAMSDRPWALFAAVVIVGGIPLPLSPVILLAGVVFTERFGIATAVLICYAAMVISMVWTYFVAAYPLHRLCSKIIMRFADRLPEVPDHHKLKVALVVRITPGIPFFVQNYFLGFSRIPFVQYLWVSLLVQAFYTTGFVVSGGAIFEGKAGLAILGLAILVVASVIIQILRKRNRTLTEAIEPAPSDSDQANPTTDE